MNNDLMKKVERLNELYSKKELNTKLTDQELTEQSILRDEVINYFQYVIRNSMEAKKGVNM